MGDFNWSVPTRLGMEWQPTSELQVIDTSPSIGIAERFKPGAVTMTAVHRYHPTVLGAAPGYALEIVDVLIPPVSTQTTFPGTDSGGSYTGWQTQAGAAGTYTALGSKNSAATYLRNSTTFQTWEKRNIITRGAAAALSGKRISSVTMYALVQCFSFSNTADIGVEAHLALGAGDYYGPMKRVPNDAKWYTPLLMVWRLNPSTAKPWTQAEVNNFLTSGGTDEFGIRVSAPRPSAVTAQGFKVAGIWVEVQYATENRVGGFYYDPGKVLTGWQRFALSSPSILNANQYYWLVEYPLIGGNGNYFNVVKHLDTKVTEGASAASANGEHRECVAVTLSSGVVTAVSPDNRTQAGTAVSSGVLGELLAGTLYEATGASILSQSDGYAQLARRKIATDSTANIGQQLTSASTTTNYGAVSLPLAYTKLGVKPDRELTIEIRHGAGALTGGGSLDATATVKPTDIDGTMARRQFNFAASFLAAATQYFVLIRSSAATGKSWDVIRLDTRSDVIDAATSTTVAQIEGSTQGGQVDCYAESGVTMSRYDLVVDLIAGPPAPAGLTVTAQAAIAGLYPPAFLVNWSATALGSSFLKYKVWGRPARSPVQPWQQWGEIDVNTGQTAAIVEAQNHSFLVLDAGWTVAGGQWSDGWDIAVSVVNAANGLESTLSVVSGNKLSPDTTAWITTSEAPYLTTPFRAISFQDNDADTLTAYKALGRDLEVTRSRAELPARTATVPFNVVTALGEDPLRIVRAVAASGLQAALLLPTGDRGIGSFSAHQVTQAVGEVTAGQITFTETARAPKLCDFNLSCTTVLNGSSQFWSTPSTSLIDPAAGAFTVIVAGAFAGAASSKAALSKGNIVGGGVGYGIVTNSNVNQLSFVAKGTTGTGNCVAVSAAMFDGNIHVAVGTSTGAVQKLYLDGALGAAASDTVATGSLTNSAALVVGADNGGVSGFMALRGQSWAIYQRVLTPAEAQAAAYCLLGYAGYRMPAGVAAFYDCRDQRSWNGLATTLHDLSGNNQPMTATAAPSARGLPWPLENLEKF